jgi:hypothetical protein
MIVDMGSAEGITAAITGMALIITVITTGELVQPPTSIEELRLVLLASTDEQLNRKEHCFYLVVHQKCSGAGQMHRLIS